ncbi:MAG: IS21 family transposase [Coriobacteriales bacterium]|nr:IS21 family transposase [Coriobacteriales bacterium]
MSKRRKILLMLAKGGLSQSDVATALHASKRDVSACARVLRERRLTFDEVSAMAQAEIDGLFPSDGRRPNEAYLQPDLEAMVARKVRSRKLPVKLMWMEYCDEAAARGRLAYSYQTFCEMFSSEAERLDAKRHFLHKPGEKVYIDWAGDVAWLTDKVLGTRTKVYVLVVVLPFSDKFWAEGFCDMKQRSWQDGQAHAFEGFGGTPRMLVPDNAATATNRGDPRVTVINEEYGRFAEHYGCAVLPARIEKPRDKSTSESAVDLVERWVIAPANEQTFYTLGEFNEFCARQVAWLNARPFKSKDGSRDSVYESEELRHMQPLPPTRYETCEWRSAKVAPDYHVTVEYMHYSVPFALIGRQVDVRLSSTAVTVLADGEVVAEHPRLRGRKGQYSTFEDHMPDNHRLQKSPWSAERFSSWARRVGPETGAAIERLMACHRIVEQSFVGCRNILGLSKSYSPDLLERACARCNELGAVPSYTGLKNAILAIRAADAESRASGAQAAPQSRDLTDRAKSAGRTNGADAYRRDDEPGDADEDDAEAGDGEC